MAEILYYFDHIDLKIKLKNDNASQKTNCFSNQIFILYIKEIMNIIFNIC